jgi:hypothetical protein
MHHVVKIWPGENLDIEKFLKSPVSLVLRPLCSPWTRELAKLKGACAPCAFPAPRTPP